jgi:hypothetical protein
MAILDDFNFSEEAAPQNFCGGPLGCEGRTCDPKMEDCQGCLKDYEAAVNHVPTQEEIDEMDWYMRNFGYPEHYEKK